MKPKEQEWILQQARQGDQKAFHQLYQDTFAQVQAECSRILNHNVQDTEDAVQETYIKIFRHLDSVQDAEAFPGWCRRIAHNTAVDLVKTRRRKTGQDDFRPPVSDDTWTGMDAVDQEDPEALPEEQAEQEMVREILQHCVNELGPQRATCFALYRQGMAYKEIAEQLALPVGTVKSNVHYAKLAVRKEIERIEKQEHVRIHGFALVLLSDGTVQVRPKNGSGAGFISAKLKDSGEQELWNRISRSLSPYKTVPFWKKALSVALSVLVLAGGILFAVQKASYHNLAIPVRNEGIQQNRNIPQTKKNSKPVKIKKNSPHSATAEQFLSQVAIKLCEDYSGDTDIYYHGKILSSAWKSNSFTVILHVTVNQAYDPKGNTRVQTLQLHDFYTYKTFSKVYWEHDMVRYQSVSQPNNKALNLYIDTSGKQQYVSGFATEKGTRKAAGI